MYDYPKVIQLKRGGKVRTTFFIQPHLHDGGCYDILRIALMRI